MGGGPRCWLDVDVGCPEAHGAAEAAYGAARGFLDACGARYGLGGGRAPESLSGEEREVATEAAAAVPEYGGRCALSARRRSARGAWWSSWRRARKRPRRTSDAW